MSSNKSNESNKIFAAILCALLTVMLAGFVTNKIVKPEKLEKDAIAIEGEIVNAGGVVDTKPKLPEPIMALLATANIEKGAKISKACAACHSFEKGGPTKQGPNLWGIVNQTKGSIAGFAYSDSLIATGGNWNYDSLNKFLWKPKTYISGTKMNFAGLKKPKDRADLIAWLRVQADTQEALPTEEQITAEQLAFAPPEEDAKILEDARNEDNSGEVEKPDSAEASEDSSKEH